MSNDLLSTRLPVGLEDIKERYERALTTWNSCSQLLRPWTKELLRPEVSLQVLVKKKVEVPASPGMISHEALPKIKKKSMIQNLLITTDLQNITDYVPILEPKAERNSKQREEDRWAFPGRKNSDKNLPNIKEKTSDLKSLAERLDKVYEMVSKGEGNLTSSARYFGKLIEPFVKQEKSTSELIKFNVDITNCMNTNWKDKQQKRLLFFLKAQKINCKSFFSQNEQEILDGIRAFCSRSRRSISNEKVKINKMLKTNALYVMTHMARYDLLTNLSLSEVQLGTQHGKIVLSIIGKYCKNIQKVNLDSNQISSACKETLIYFLNNCKDTLIKLNLSNNDLGDDLLGHISVHLFACKQLNSLSIASIGVKNIGGIAIGKIIRYCVRLKYINVSGNAISGQGAYEVARALINLKSLKVLLLDRCGLVDVDLKELAKTLKTSKCIRCVGLRNNRITRVGLSALADGLRENKSVRHLALARNELIQGVHLDLLKKSLPVYKKVTIVTEDEFKKSRNSKPLYKKIYM